MPGLPKQLLRAAVDVAKAVSSQGYYSILIGGGALVAHSVPKRATKVRINYAL